MTVEELKVIITAELSGLKNTVNQSKKSLKSINKVADSVQKKLKGAFNINTTKIDNSINKLNKNITGAEEGFNAISGIMAGVQGQLSSFGKGFSIGGIATSLSGISKQFDESKLKIIEVLSEWEKIENQKLSGAITEESYLSSLEQLKKKYKDVLSLMKELQKNKMMTVKTSVDKDKMKFKFNPTLDEQKARDYVNNYSPQGDINQATGRMAQYKQELQEQMNQLNQLKTALKEQQSEYKKVSSEIDKLQPKINKLSEKWHELTSALISANQQMGITMTPAEMESVIPRLSEVNKQLSAIKDKYNSLSERKENLSEGIKKSTTEIYKANSAIDSTKSKIEETKEKIKEAKNQLKGTTKQMSKLQKMWKMGKTTVGFMALSKLVSSITKNLGECYNALMKFDNANKNILGYNTAMSNLTSAFKRLSGEIAVTMAQLATALEPVLTPIINFTTEFVTTLSKLFAALQGKDSVAVVNKDYWKNYSDSLKDANKEQKKFLAGFDELTVLNENKTDTDNLEDLYKIEKLTGVFAEISKHNKKILEMLAAFAGIAAILKLVNLLFGKKNSTLSKQTILTDKESGAVKGLNANYGLLTAGALGLAGALGGILFPKPEGSEEWQPALQPAISTVGQLDEQLQNMNNTARQTAPVLSTVQSSVRSLLSIPKVALDVALNLNPLNSGIGIAKNLYKTFGQALIQQQKANGTEMTKSQDSVLQQIKTNLGTWLTGLPIMFAQCWENIKTNVANGTAQTYSNIASWCSATSQAVRITIGNWGESIYNGLTYTGNAITSWGQGSYNALVSWGQGVSQLFADVGNSIITSIGQALSNAWEGIKEVASAAGQKVKDFHKNYGKQIAITGAVISGALVLGAIALSAPTGGGSLAAIPALAALADGGVLTTPTPALVGEYQGARTNPEIVTPQNIMRETVSEANMEVVNAIYAIGNQITKAVDDKDMDVYMDADKVTRKVTKRQDTIKRQQGTSLVTI